MDINSEAYDDTLLHIPVGLWMDVGYLLDGFEQIHSFRFPMFVSLCLPLLFQPDGYAFRVHTFESCSGMP